MARSAPLLCWQFVVLFGVALPCLTALQAADTAPAAPPAPTPNVTRDRVFSIPFYLNPKSQPPQLVALFVSHDQGRTWSNYQQRAPQEGRFDFLAKRDGEYWFVVRTNFDAGPPNEQTKPEKIVIVDQTEPQVELRATQRPGGGVSAEWTARDATLDVQSFRLEYRATSSDGWNPVPVVNRQPEPGDADGLFTLSHSTHWTISSAVPQVEVRVSIGDRAGNVRTETTTLDLSTVAQHRSPTVVAEQQDWASPTATPPADDGAAADQWRPVRQSDGNQFQADRPFPPPPAEPWLASDAGPETGSRAAMESTARPSLPEPTPPADIVPAREPAWETYQDPVSAATPPLPGVGESDLTDVETGAAGETPLQITRSSQFNLDYDVEDLGPDQVGRVELWVTADAGRTWRAYGQDEDLKSPMRVTLDQDGRYGFKLVIYDRDMESRRPPQSGEAPELTVVVDRMIPELQLTDAHFVPHAGAASVRITWQAADAHFDAQPIRLSYAPMADGPWVYFADGIANSGLYEWMPGGRLPRTTYIRIEAVDAAGNVATQVTREPLGASGKQPRAVIRSLNPIPGQ